MTKIYRTKEEVQEKAREAENRTLREIVDETAIQVIEHELLKYRSNRKGFLGYLVEKYFFDIEPGSDTGPDFKDAGVELKTTPLKKHAKKKYVSKERLVFSMIDYKDVVNETWEESSFLKKNKTLLLMFYLWLKDESIVDHKFKFVHLLDLLEDISKEDVYQIRKDWEYIVGKIKRGEAHLLSEADTYYLGACTKAANSSVLRDQPMRSIKAKPRAFSFKQQYLNYLIQKELLGNEDANTDSIFKTRRRLETIEEAIHKTFAPFVGNTGKQVESKLDVELNKAAKGYKRTLVNRILGVETNNIKELEKANITLRVVTLEHTGTLKESISFPSFDYKDLVTQVWYDEERDLMSDFHAQLESKKFLFVVFQKQKDSTDIILKKILFWNFPMGDLEKAKEVWEKTVELINKGKIVKEIKKQKGEEQWITYFPGQSFNGVAHVRPHGGTREDTAELPVVDEYTGNKEHTKQCFWLNAKYIQKAIENEKDQA